MGIDDILEIRRDSIRVSCTFCPSILHFCCVLFGLLPLSTGAGRVIEVAYLDTDSNTLTAHSLRAQLTYTRPGSLLVTVGVHVVCLRSAVLGL